MFGNSRFNARMISALLVCGLAFAAGASFAADEGAVTDGEVWNEGVEYFRNNDVTNALRVLRPLMLSKTHGARAAEVVAKLEYDRGNLEEAAGAAQIALRAAPDDAKANRNFTRATDGLPQMRETQRINDILRKYQGQDPGAMLLAATKDARQLMADAGAYRTNAPAKAVALADALSKRAERLADTWIPVREVIAQSVTNEEQAATIIQQISEAQAKTKTAVKEFGDLGEGAFAAMSDVEHDFTRFLKLTVMPPAAMGEDLVAQSNAWLDAERVNGRAWQPEALDFTRAFRERFPAWARAYEMQAQADTNRRPFTAEAQAKVSGLATQLEKLQIECCEKPLPPEQERALGIIREILELLPNDGGGGGGQPQPNQQPQDKDRQKQNPQAKPDEQQQDKSPEGAEGEQPEEQQPEGEQPEDGDDKDAPKDEPEEGPDDKEIEAVLKRAQERSEEHEADKRARMRKAPPPPNERDW